MATAFSQFETLIAENLGKFVHNLMLPEVDDPMLSIIDSMEAVGLGGRRQPDGSTSAADYSSAAGYEARLKLTLQRGGMIKGSGWSGNTVEMQGANSDTPVGQQADALYPDPTKVPMRMYKTIFATLKRIKGNLTVNKSQILADIIGNGIADVAGDYVEDAIFQTRTNTAAWAYGDQSGSLAQCVNAEGLLTAQHVIELKTGTFNRFIKGQRYVFGDDSAGWPGTKTQLGGIARCVNVDSENRTIQLEMETGETAPTLAVDDHIILEGTVDFPTDTSLVHNGIENLFINTGLLHGLDVTVYNELKARVDGDASNLEQPTPELIAKSLDYIADSREELPSVIISERSVQSHYAQLEKAGFATYVIPTAGGQQMGGGVGAGVDQGVQFQHGNKVFNWLVSSFIRPNSLALIAPETLVKFAPGGDNAIRWSFREGGMAGAPGIFGPVYVGGQLSELMQAPFEAHGELLCRRPRRNARILGVHSQRTS